MITRHDLNQTPIQRQSNWEPTLKHLALNDWQSEDEYNANRFNGIQAIQQSEARERLNQKKAAKQAAIQELQEREAFYANNPNYGAF